jgi:hypothetical protein
MHDGCVFRRLVRTSALWKFRVKGTSLMSIINFLSLREGEIFDENEIEKLKESLTLEIKADLYGDNSIKKQLTLKFNG